MFILAPKNTGLEQFRKNIINNKTYLQKDEIIDARGEDIPFLIEEMYSNGRNVIGLTGEDLFQEYLLKTSSSKVEIIEKIEWDDPKALFGKPTLCLLGDISNNGDALEIPKEATVCISSAYANIANRYLNQFEVEGYKFKKIYINGCVEMTTSQGIADLIIDIVYTGKSMERYNLAVYDVIFSSDFVIIRGKLDE